MRTRRSWRNQERLWKALGGPAPPKAPPAPAKTRADIEAMWWVSKRTRAALIRELERKERP